MINIAEILKNYPKRGVLYSTIFGECEFDHISSCGDIYMAYKNNKDDKVIFNKYGQFGIGNTAGECLLFPSKDNRDWSTLRKQCQFKPFDKVVVRCGSDKWCADLFSYYESDNNYPYSCVGSFYSECLPYNEETAKLIGTQDEYNR